MKVVFREIGETKFSKIVELTTFPKDKGIIDFCIMEAAPYMPKDGSVELVAQDGLPEFMSGHFVLVHLDKRYLYTGMGTVLVYR